VVSYLDRLVEEAQREGRPVVVVLDRAPCHRAKAVREERAGWEAKGLKLYYLPSYCPHLNPIEGVWRRLKGFLMPRRFYDSLAKLKRSVLSALSLLGAKEVYSQPGGTYIGASQRCSISKMQAPSRSRCEPQKTG
jgi:putative transposase